MIQKYQHILDNHQQHREFSCFQMTPKLALKFFGILRLHDNPFQNHHCWDRKGYEPYVTPHIVGKHLVTFRTPSFCNTLDQLFDPLRQELEAGYFPVVSLSPRHSSPAHGFVVLEKVSDSDFLVVTKTGDMTTNQPCLSLVDKLSNLLPFRPKVDCLFWKATDDSDAHILQKEDIHP